MFKPHEMNSVLIAGPTNLQEKVINKLHELNILHIVDHSKNELADIGGPLESAHKLSEALVKIRSLMSVLKIKKEQLGEDIEPDEIDEIYSITEKINNTGVIATLCYSK